MGLHVDEREADAGVAEAKLADDAREEAAGSPKEETDGEGAVLAVERLAGEVEGALGGFEGFAGFFKEDLALGGEADGAAGTIEEGSANLTL